MDQAIRNKLRGVVTQCRKLLEDSVRHELQGKFGIYAAKKDDVQIDDENRLNLSAEERPARKDILDHFAHIKARGFKAKDALDQLVREIAFTHLNRLCAYKMMEARQVYIGDQKFREAVSRGINSNGVKFYLADHPDDERLFNTGKQDVAYRHFLDWVGGLLSDEIGVLFNPHDSANRLYPTQHVLDQVLDLINDESLDDIWAQDETIGWVYQYFTPKELRDQARKESAAPRNSYELAFRNQFFTPRYVVEFLTDNTLGRIWYEMRQGQTKLKDQCRYMVRRPNEVFLAEGSSPPEPTQNQEEMSQEELLKQPVHIPHRPKKAPHELRILDPACGSGHFLLYCFDLLLTIYEEAYADPDLGPKLKEEYPTLDALRRDVPRLILAHNLHGIDIDLRCTQIAALALWLRCQRAYQEMGLKKDRPKITRSNFVCAEPMPGEKEMLKEFVDQLQPKVLGHLVEVVFDKMKMAGETGSLLKIEEELRDAIAAAKQRWVAEHEQATDRKGRPLLFTRAEMERVANKTPQPHLFDFSEITDEQFWSEAESQVLSALRSYAAHASNGAKLQRQLFTEDAVQGFSFIDLCSRHYDVALTNPPFGNAIPDTRSYFAAQYPTAGQDLCAATVQRLLDVMHGGGLVGCITTRTALFLLTLADWRDRVLSTHRFVTVADLGYGILDAMVETAMYVLESGGASNGGPSCFLSLLTTTEKEAALKQFFGPNASSQQWRYQSDFVAIPGKTLAYWVPASLVRRFGDFPTFNKKGGYIRQGIATADDFRFLRLFWEVSPSEINTEAPKHDKNFNTHRWVPMAKGGEYSPWWDDIHLLLNWHNSGAELKNFRDDDGKLRSRPQNLEWFFQPGLTYPYRTTSGFGLRCLPSGCAFNNGGWGVFPRDPHSFEDLLAVFNSRPARYFMEILLGQGDSSVAGSAARNHGAESVGGIPFPEKPLPEAIRDKVRQLIVLWREASADETTAYYSGPMWRSRPGQSLHETAMCAWQTKCGLFRRIAELSGEIDVAVCDQYRLTEIDKALIAEEEGTHPCSYPRRACDVQRVRELFSEDISTVIANVQARVGSKRFVVKKAFFVDRWIDLVCHLLQANPSSVLDVIQEAEGPPGWPSGIVQECLSVIVGACLGRWDVSLLASKGITPDSAKPLQPLPTFSPFAVQPQDVGNCQQDKVTGNESNRQGYPEIIPDDPDYSDDIVRRVREVLELIWKSRAEAIEKEACEILGVEDLRQYFRKPTKGGFWDDHVSRYSKSRRKAPIYWLLQSSKRNYALWLHYHRLDKETLLKALLPKGPVQTKINLEQSRLDDLRKKRKNAEGDTKTTKKLDKDIDKQEDLLNEIKDFAEKLERAAKLEFGDKDKLNSKVQYTPDLNDGVVLNIAPLHELVPWKEAKKYWDELLEGKYEWSSMSKLLREKGLIN